MARHVVQLICLIVSAALYASSTSQHSESDTINLKIIRRNGRFARRESANITHLSNLLDATEQRYKTTYRDANRNRLVRKWQKLDDDDGLDTQILQGIGRDGSWFTTIPIGEPAQNLEFDLDMLSVGFFTAMTTSSKGTKYNTFMSTSHVETNEKAHSFCRRSSDIFSLEKSQSPHRLDLPMCTPPKASRLTTFPSGSILGLAPRGSLDRIASPTLIDQLIDQKRIDNLLWSITLLDAENGVLSLGGTIVEQVEKARIQGEIELEHFGDPIATPDWVEQETQSRLDLAMPDKAGSSSSLINERFKWTDIQGSAGWWSALMAGVWVDGVKVLKNQPVLFDIQCPFILAPPVAASRFYDSISGAKRLDSASPSESTNDDDNNFYAFPCLNRVNIAFEFAGWIFPVMSGETSRADALYGPAGGRFSLGKYGNGTGYCVGAVVETRMGMRKDWANSGMRDVWVLGEPFFRGLGVVFDVDGGRVGLRSY